MTQASRTLPCRPGLYFCQFSPRLLSVATLAALSSLYAQAYGQPVVRDYSGAPGTCCHSSNGFDGAHGRDYLASEAVSTSVDAGTGVFVTVSGGDGGHGKGAGLPYPGTNYNHWGGNGGYGAILNYTLRDSTVTTHSGVGLRAISKGGEGGKWATQSGGRRYGDGGDGHNADVTVTNSKVSATTYGVWVTSQGGTGQSASMRNFLPSKDGGRGGHAGPSSATLTGRSVVTVRNESGNAGAGMLAESLGGRSEDTQHGGVGGGHSTAGAGGNTGDVTLNVEAGSSIETYGANTAGMVGRTVGGKGGGAIKVLGGQPAADVEASRGGDAGYVTVTNAGTLTTHGPWSAAISALSQGGDGGDGGSGSWSFGHKGGDGGTAHGVRVVNHGSITTQGDYSNGIEAEVRGGHGGQGGDGQFSSHGGSGGVGAGTGQLAIDIANGQGGTINLSGKGSFGIVAHAVGGGGGRGGNSNGMYVVGGAGGAGGAGGHIHASNAGVIMTSADQSAGVLLQSIGGGGGVGGDANAIGVIVAMAVGGSGGAAGNGNDVEFESSGKISTRGAGSSAVTLQSIGGGGGHGGSAKAASVGVLLGVALSTGGSGGAAGNAGKATIDLKEDGDIETTGAVSSAVLVQSIGGGGGNGGFAESAQATIAPNLGPEMPTGTASIHVTTGGSGGAAGAGGTVQIDNAGRIHTAGAESHGVLAQSIGGGGGNAGVAAAALRPTTIGASNFTISYGVTVGGNGAGGGNGGEVSIANHAAGSISTVGDHAAGMLAQSIGGGGGNAGSVQEETEQSFEPAVESPTAFMETLDKVIDWMEKAPESVSFGGVGFALDTRVGGNGGEGGNGGKITLVNHGTVTTRGDAAAGLVAQSIAGGGGRSGAVNSSESSTLLSSIDTLFAAANEGANSILSVAPSVGFNVALGGTSGKGGDAGVVDITNTGQISTAGFASSALFAQSVGGGGGEAAMTEQNLEELIEEHGANHAAEIIEKVDTVVEFLASKGMSLYKNINVNVGGGSQSGGNGAAVTVNAVGATSQIATAGDHSAGIAAQSIGGGGGKAEVSRFMIGPGGFKGGGGSAQEPLAIGMGATQTFSANASGVVMSSGQVTVNTAAVTTHGNNAPGVLAQSISAGGGLVAVAIDGLDSTALAAGVAAQSPSIALGANLKSGGGSVPQIIASGASVTTTGNVVTAGVLSHGVMAQSIGGGGGAATLGYSKETAPVLAAARLSLGMTSEGGVPVRANGGAVSVTTGYYVQSDDGVIPHIRVATSGALAFGILAQSVGAGGGYIGLLGDRKAEDELAVAFGAGENALGDGGKVDVHLYLNNVITTRGKNAVGVVAQSVGGGGGIAGLATKASATTLARPASFGQGGGGTVNVKVDGTINTQGAGAIGVLAQSVGGGGGLTGDFSSVSYGGNMVKATDALGGTGNGGHVSVDVSGITSTEGSNAPAIVALSLGGGAVFSENGIQVGNRGSGAGSIGGAVDVSVDSLGLVASNGANSPAIFAASAGSAGQDNGGAIHIRTGAKSGVLALASGGTAIRAITDNVVAVENKGLIAGATGIDASGRVSVNNLGTFVGSVIAGNAAGSTFVNHPGALLASGTRLDAALTNQGTLNPGGAVASGGAYQATRISGYTQTGSGVYQADADFESGSADLISVAGVAQAQGNIQVLGRNTQRGQSLKIAEFDGGAAGTFTMAQPSPVLSYNLEARNDGRELWVTPQADFLKNAAQLNPNQANVAGYLQTLWDAPNQNLNQLFDPFAQLGSMDEYAKALSTLASDAALSRATNRTYETHTLLNRMMSCPYFESASTLLTEGECGWLRVGHGRFDRSASSDSAGYDNRQTTVQAGLQRQVAPNWFVGGSAVYTRTNTWSADNTVHLSSDGFYGGLTLKHQRGPWQFAGALLGGYERSDQTRNVVLPGVAARATSQPDSYMLATRLRAAYEVPFDNWYVKPYADLDIIYDRTSSYTESGGGVYDLTHRSSDRWSAVLTPSIEFGGKIETGKTTIRPYLSLGVGLVAGRKVSSDVALVAAPQYGFTLATRMPGVFGTVNAGVELLTADKWSVRAEYGLQAAEHLMSQTASLRVGMHF